MAEDGEEDENFVFSSGQHTQKFGYYLGGVGGSFIKPQEDLKSSAALTLIVADKPHIEVTSSGIL